MVVQFVLSANCRPVKTYCPFFNFNFFNYFFIGFLFIVGRQLLLFMLLSRVGQVFHFFAGRGGTIVPLFRQGGTIDPPGVGQLSHSFGRVVQLSHFLGKVGQLSHSWWDNCPTFLDGWDNCPTFFGVGQLSHCGTLSGSIGGLICKFSNADFEMQILKCRF